MSDRYAVIGNPIAHSKSPEIHARFAALTGQDIVYERVLAPLDGFVHTVHEMVRQGARGANVTVPFKLEACSLATSLTERAQLAGAVNTLTFRDDKIIGDNTDGIGLVTDIVRNAGFAFDGRRVLLLGAGGAARGAVLPVLQQRPAQLIIANRTPQKAAALAQQFSRFGPVAASDLASLDAPFDIIINATSASLAAEAPSLAPVVYALGALAYDMMYASRPSLFMHTASEHGAVARDGLGMLVEQAAEAFLVWRGVRPDTAPVFAMLRAQLQAA